MKKLYVIASAVLALTFMAMPNPAKAWYSYRCIRIWHPPVVHHCCCCCHYRWYHTCYHPTVIIEEAPLY